mmetsp:Transcript_7605/g.21785  ORF Transcript_7605/g.21785 Transcript_7605/m.21785 type:complete len:271 (+) Transcript_7605:399-1211(+)
MTVPIIGRIVARAPRNVKRKNSVSAPPASGNRLAKKASDWPSRMKALWPLPRTQPATRTTLALRFSTFKRKPPGARLPRVSIPTSPDGESGTKVMRQCDLDMKGRHAGSAASNCSKSPDWCWRPISRLCPIAGSSMCRTSRGMNGNLSPCPSANVHSSAGRSESVHIATAPPAFIPIRGFAQQVSTTGIHQATDGCSPHRLTSLRLRRVTRRTRNGASPAAQVVKLMQVPVRIGTAASLSNGSESTTNGFGESRRSLGAPPTPVIKVSSQ